MRKFDFTTASRSELSLVWNAIAQEMGDDRFFTTKELDHLPKVLDVEEQVLAFSSGFHKGSTWLIVLTDQRILFIDKGMIFGVKTSSIELERINNFDYKKGVFFGSISIGSNAEVYEISNVWKKTIEPFIRKLRQAIKAKQDGVEMFAPGVVHPVETQVKPEPVIERPVETPWRDVPAPRQEPVKQESGNAAAARMQKAGLL